MVSNSENPASSSPRRHVADIFYEAASRAASSKAIESQLEDLPALSLFTFVTSLMTLGRRILKIGKIELGVAEFMSWQRPAMTVTILFGYTILCYHPQWLVMLPLFYFVFGVLVPNYAEKFKLSEENDTPSTKFLIEQGLENDLFTTTEQTKEEEKKAETRNLLVAIRQGQKALSNFVSVLDRFDEFRMGPAKFQDPQISSIMLVGAFVALATGTYALMFVSVPLFFCILGWGLVCSKHPLAKLTTEKLEDLYIEPQLDMAVLKEKFITFCRSHVLIDDGPLSRTVEIYELQPRGLTAREWVESKTVYSNDPYLPGSTARMFKQRPVGPNDLSDILPPDGWYFDIADDWVPDKDPEESAPSRGLGEALIRKGVTIEADWVYDLSTDEDYDNGEYRVWKRRRLTRNCYCDLR